MSVEQVARDFVTAMNNQDKTRGYLTADALVDGGVLPRPVPATEALSIMNALTTAMPDLKIDVLHVTVDGNQATVDTRWGGTQSGKLSLPIPGLPALPPTGKKVSVKDTYVVTVQGDKVSHMTVESPADGGIPAALAQLGIKAPGM